MAEHVDPPAMPPVKPMPAPPDARIIPLDRQEPLTHAQVEQVRFGLGDTGPLAQAVMNANVPALAKQLATGAVQCLSTRRPADPVVGQMIWETDTQQVRFWTGSAWVTPANATPTGSLQAFAGSAAPTGWLFCFGQAVSRTTYADLYAAITNNGATFPYGSGDGSTTFNLPDLRGRIPAGKDDMGGTAASRLTAGVSGVTGTTLGATGGSEALHQHTHTQNSHNHGGSTGNVNSYNSAYGPAYLHSTGNRAALGAGWGVWAEVDGYRHTHTINSDTATNQNTGTGNSQNVQPTIITNYIIKT